jgi:hypothetical protein
MAFRDYMETKGNRASGRSGAIVVADQLVRLRGIDAPELDQTFWWRGDSVRHDVIRRP